MNQVGCSLLAVDLSEARRRTEASANDCGDPTCCHLQICKGNQWCAPFDCTRPLPNDCNGRIGFDCDDFPEDCDVHCCICVQGC